MRRDGTDDLHTDTTASCNGAFTGVGLSYFVTDISRRYETIQCMFIASFNLPSVRHPTLTV